MIDIKVCGLRDPQNISAIAALKVDYLGFIFYAASARNVLGQEIIPSGALQHSMQQAQAQGKKLVGVFVQASIEKVLQIVADYKLDIVQLHGDEDVDYCRILKNKNIKIWKAISIHNDYDFSELLKYNDCIDAFLFDTAGAQKGGNGIKFDWQLLANYQLKTPFWLSGGISVSDTTLIQQIQHPQLIGVDINSRFELSPALKDVALVKEFINKMKIT